MEPLTQFQEDVLADILQTVRLNSSLYCRAQLGAPWGLGVPRQDVAVFHIVTGGACWLTVKGSDKSVLLGEGDLIILPHGHAHVVTDHPNTPATQFEDFVSRHPPAQNGFVYGRGHGAVSTLVCGAFQLEDYSTNPLYALLPTCLHVSSQRQARDTMDQNDREAGRGRGQRAPTRSRIGDYSAVRDSVHPDGARVSEHCR